MSRSPIDLKIKSIEKKLIEWRRALHQIPVTGFLEFQTTAFIVAVLSKFDCSLFVEEAVMTQTGRKGMPSEREMNDYYYSGLAIEQDLLARMKDGMTGCVAVFDSGQEGPHTVVRFDIDALPIEETQNENHLPNQESFASTRFGSMHACGHDGHAAIGIGVAHLLDGMKEEPKG